MRQLRCPAPVQDVFDDIRCEQGQAQNPTNVGVPDPLSLGQLSHDANRASSNMRCHRCARASALASVPLGCGFQLGTIALPSAP